MALSSVHALHQSPAEYELGVKGFATYLCLWYCSTSKVMSALPAAEQQQQEQQQSSDDARAATTSAPQIIPGASHKHATAHHRHIATSNQDASPSPGSSPLLSNSSSSPGNYLRKQRYGKWPNARSNANDRSGSASRKDAGSAAGSLNVGRTFTWPAYMDRQQLQQGMKRGHIFRLVQRPAAEHHTASIGVAAIEFLQPCLPHGLDC